MKIPASITISRPQYGDGHQLITIRIRDEVSRIGFIDAEIDLAEFAKALTGLSHCEMTAEVRGLQYVGMKCVQEDRQIVCPLKNCDRDKLKQWLIDNAQEDGWLLNTYLGSQSSVSGHKSGGQLLRYSVYKYITPEPEQP